MKNYFYFPCLFGWIPWQLKSDIVIFMQAEIKLRDLHVVMFGWRSYLIDVSWSTDWAFCSKWRGKTFWDTLYSIPLHTKQINLYPAYRGLMTPWTVIFACQIPRPHSLEPWHASYIYFFPWFGAYIHISYLHVLCSDPAVDYTWYLATFACCIWKWKKIFSFSRK
jgi:hypothetical protein